LKDDSWQTYRLSQGDKADAVSYVQDGRVKLAVV